MKLCELCKKELRKELEIHLDHYKKSNKYIVNFINSFLNEIDIS